MTQINSLIFFIIHLTTIIIIILFDNISTFYNMIKKKRQGRPLKTKLPKTYCVALTTCTNIRDEEKLQQSCVW
jgi:hypothetical protein